MGALGGGGLAGVGEACREVLGYLPFAAASPPVDGYVRVCLGQAFSRRLRPAGSGQIHTCRLEGVFKEDQETQTGVPRGTPTPNRTPVPHRECSLNCLAQPLGQ